MALPLPVEQLPEAIRRFGNPAAPIGARTMAAKGLVPVKGQDLVTLLAQLTADVEPTVAAAARQTLRDVPEAVLLPAASAALPGEVLEVVVEIFGERQDVIELIVSNASTPNELIERIARTGNESITEMIAVNQERLLAAPRIIEALYKNRRTRMSTADRIIELAARNGVDLPGIPAYKDHVEAIQGTLIPEPTDEPLPSDLEFAKALESDEADPNAIEVDPESGEEKAKEKFLPLRMQIQNMSKAEKIRMCVIGDAAARAILVRDNNRAIAQAAIRSPSLTNGEAEAIATSKEVSNEILRSIGNRKEWARDYKISRALVFNPKTPVGISLRCLGLMRESDIKEASRSRNVSMAVKTAAIQRMVKKQG